MMPAAKHGDPQIGVDIHLCVVPPSPSPVPLPTPHTSIVFDPMDYIPYIGATVTVCGMKRAVAGTSAKAIHIPPGFPFAPKIPDTSDEIFMGSATVVADGDPFSFLAVPVLSCQVAGMLSPPRLKKKEKKLMLLPTVTNLAIPTNVFVGGPPTISLMGMAFKLGFAALGKFAKSNLFKKMRQKLFGKMKSGFLKCVILRAEPIDIITGEVSVEQEDFTLRGRIPLQWVRSYTSNNRRRGACGYGWETPADVRLEVYPQDNSVAFLRPAVAAGLFPKLPEAGGHDGAVLELWDGALLSDHGSEFRVRTKEERIYHFEKALAFTNEDGVREYPIRRISDLCGNSLEFERRDPRLICINESAGRRIEIEMEYGLIRQLSLFVPSAKFRRVFVQYRYDEADDLVSAVDALGNPYTFAYHSHHLIRHTDRNGLSFYYEFDTDGDAWRVIHSWGDGGLYNYRFQYLEQLNERRIIDSLGNVSLVKLDEDNLPISEIDPLGGATIFEYDEMGRTSAVVDADGHRTEYEYDERGNLLKLTRADGTTVITEFSAENKAIRIIDPNGAEWQSEWDTRGLLTRQLSPSGAESRFKYDTLGQLTTFINPMKGRTTLEFDRYGNLSRYTDALGHSTMFNFDLMGNMISRIEPLGRQTNYSYDLKGRLTHAVWPSGANVGCTYDAEDQLICYKDENAAITRLEYCGLGEVRRRLQPDGHVVEFDYDTEERLIAVINQCGERYEFKHDALGRVVEEIDYWGQVERYLYTAAGQLRQSVDPLGRITCYETDPLGRILKKILPHPHSIDCLQAEIFCYDGNGKIIACENEVIRIERIFDPVGRLMLERQGDDCVITNEYDLKGNRTRRVTTLTLGGENHTNAVNYYYDALDQTVKVEVANHIPIQIKHNELRQITEEILSPRLRRRTNYSAGGPIRSQTLLAAEVPILEKTYSYGHTGDITEITDSIHGTDRYWYDPLGRVTAHLDPDGLEMSFWSDPCGDRLITRVVRPPEHPGHVEGWYRAGRYRDVWFRFDRVGNLVERSGPEGTMEFSWDTNQRLAQSRNRDEVTNYQYDPLGRRVIKETAGVATRFFWDGDAVLGDARHNEANSQSDHGFRIREWVYHPQTFEPMAMIHLPRGYSGELRDASPYDLYFYHNDPNGCATRLLDTAGKIVWAARYGALGAVDQMNVDLVDNPLRLQGQYWDAENHLCYNRHRYYDPAHGQFISKDPLDFLGSPREQYIQLGDDFDYKFLYDLGECFTVGSGSFGTQDPLGIRGGENFYRFAPNVWAWIDPLGLACKKPRSKFPIGKRKRFPTMKEAREAAEKASPFGKAVKHVDSPHGPHFHPADAAGKALNHDHYFFPWKFV